MTELEKKIEVKRLEITKNVAELTLECGKLIAENEELKKAVTEKNSLVEKMKCCANCSKILVCENRNADEFCNSCDEWGFEE